MMKSPSLPVFAETVDRPIHKQNISVTEALKVVRLRVRAGHTVPEHHSNADVVATVVRGNGRFNVAGRDHSIAPGSVIVMRPGAPHTIVAGSELELIVVHARLASAGEAASCGA
jgi:quercetin dioxygenase-like cupin family protein